MSHLAILDRQMRFVRCRCNFNAMRLMPPIKKRNAFTVMLLSVGANTKTVVSRTLVVASRSL